MNVLLQSFFIIGIGNWYLRIALFRLHRVELGFQLGTV